MKTEILDSKDPGALRRARQVLRSGGLVAFPTDTVYGLGCEVLNAEAVSRLYHVKGRPEEKAIPVLASGTKALSQVAKPFPEIAMRLAKRFWPGPLTLVVWRLPELPPELSRNETVAVRVPDHELALALLKKVGPMAVTSANRAGKADSVTAIDVLATLGGTFDLLLDGGEAPGGMPSTVVDCTQAEPYVLRAGPISADDIIGALK